MMITKMKFMKKWKFIIDYEMGVENDVDHENDIYENDIYENDIFRENDIEIDNEILDKNQTTLSLSSSWKSFDDAVKYIKNYARQNGIEVSIISSRPTAKFLKCHYSGTKRSGRSK